LALAKREGIPALTAERRWLDIAVAVDVAVDLIR
jgi:ribonuclease VapC